MTMQHTEQHSDYDNHAVEKLIWVELGDAGSAAYQAYATLSAAIEERAQHGTQRTDADIAALQAAARRVCQTDDLGSLLTALNANAVQWLLTSVPHGEGDKTWFTAELSSGQFDGVWSEQGQSEVAALRAALAKLATFYRANQAAWAASPVKQQELAYVEQVLHDAQV